jgi:uncharacterized protein
MAPFNDIVTSEQELRDLLGVPAPRSVRAAHGKTPQPAIGVEIDQCFLHCAKAFQRSKLWAHAEWPAPDALASMAHVLHDQIKPAGITVEDYECEVEERNQKQLY